MPNNKIYRLDWGISHLDAFCDRVRAEAPIELCGARRHARAGVRSKTEGTIAGQVMNLASKELEEDATTQHAHIFCP